MLKTRLLTFWVYYTSSNNVNPMVLALENQHKGAITNF